MTSERAKNCRVACAILPSKGFKLTQCEPGIMEEANMIKETKSKTSAFITWTDGLNFNKASSRIMGNNARKLVCQHPTESVKKNSVKIGLNVVE